MAAMTAKFKRGVEVDTTCATAQPGDGATFPKKNDTLRMHYTGTLAKDGSKFDSSRDRDKPFEFTIGTGQVIKGWDLGIMTMKLGEKAELTIKSEYGYGAMGSPPQIPGGATLIFDVELMSIADRRPTRWMMSDPELMRTATHLKDLGNIKFKERAFKLAEG